MNRDWIYDLRFTIYDLREEGFLPKASDKGAPSWDRELLPAKACAPSEGQFPGYSQARCARPAFVADFPRLRFGVTPGRDEQNLPGRSGRRLSMGAPTVGLLAKLHHLFRPSELVWAAMVRTGVGFGANLHDLAGS